MTNCVRHRLPGDPQHDGSDRGWKRSDLADGFDLHVEPTVLSRLLRLRAQCVGKLRITHGCSDLPERIAGILERLLGEFHDLAQRFALRARLAQRVCRRDELERDTRKALKECIVHLPGDAITLGQLLSKAQSHRTLPAPSQCPCYSALLRDIHDAADVCDQLTMLVKIRLTNGMYVPDRAIWTNNPVM